MDDQISSLASPLVMGIDFQAAGSWTSNVNTQFSFLMKPIFFFHMESISPLLSYSYQVCISKNSTLAI